MNPNETKDETIELPVRYDEAIGEVLDEDGQTVADIHTTTILDMDEVGKHIAAAINAYSELEALRSELSALRKANEWVSVQDVVPDDFAVVLISWHFNGRPDVGIARYYRGEWTQENGHLVDSMVTVTHWRERPAPYTGDLG